MSGKILELCDIHKSFADKHVLRGLEIGVEPGQSVVVIGGSGSGKSVTLKCALGLIQPERGEVRFDGAVIDSAAGMDKMRRRTGMLFQGGALFDSLSVWENVAFALLYRYGMARNKARDKAMETLAKLRLDASVGEQMPSELSGGMQKRVALARAIADTPALIFFDEPTTGLDPITTAAVNELIREQVEALGAAAITISHDMASVRRIADHVAMLFEGRIIWSGPVGEIDDSNNPYVDQFVHGCADGPIRPAI